MVGFNINEFRERGLIYGGARPSQFLVQITPPAGIGVNVASRVQFLVHAASLPAMQIGQVGAPYFGETIKFAGDRTFGDWMVGVINDEDFAIRAMLESWSNAINALISNRMAPDTWPTGYKTNATVYQHGKDGALIRAYRFEGIWPMMIDQIQLGWGMKDSMEEFGVTFSVDYYEPVNQSTSPDQYNPLLPDDQQGPIGGNPSVFG